MYHVVINFPGVTQRRRRTVECVRNLKFNGTAPPDALQESSLCQSYNQQSFPPYLTFLDTMKPVTSFTISISVIALFCVCGHNSQTQVSNIENSYDCGNKQIRTRFCVENAPMAASGWDLNGIWSFSNCVSMDKTSYPIYYNIKHIHRRDTCPLLFPYRSSPITASAYRIASCPAGTSRPDTLQCSQDIAGIGITPQQTFSEFKIFSNFLFNENISTINNTNVNLTLANGRITNCPKMKFAIDNTKVCIVSKRPFQNEFIELEQNMTDAQQKQVNVAKEAVTGEYYFDKFDSITKLPIYRSVGGFALEYARLTTTNSSGVTKSSMQYAIMSDFENMKNPIVVYSCNLTYLLDCNGHWKLGYGERSINQNLIVGECDDIKKRS